MAQAPWFESEKSGWNRANNAKKQPQRPQSTRSLEIVLLRALSELRGCVYVYCDPVLAGAGGGIVSFVKRGTISSRIAS
jgi:hypothetical protein